MPSLPLDWIPHHSPDLVEERVEDQLVVYDPWRDRVHLLNTSAAAVLDLCDGKTTVAEIIGTFKSILPENGFDCEQEVPRILGEMLDQGLLE